MPGKCNESDAENEPIVLSWSATKYFVQTNQDWVTPMPAEKYKHTYG